MGEYGEGRHVHRGFVPRLGGVAVYAGFSSQVYLIIAHNSQAEGLSKDYYLLLFCRHCYFSWDFR